MNVTVKQIALGVMACSAMVAAMAIGAGVANAASSANASEEMCKTSIVAVSGSNPALTKVTITIKKGGRVIAIRERHSFEIKLRCKVQYTAVADSGDSKATRNFYAGGLVKLPLSR